MGGGGAMRAAAKFTGIGVLSSGFRGSNLVENPVNFATRNVVRPASTALVTLSSTGDLTVGDVAVDQTVQNPSWEFDEWEFAGGEADFVVDRINSVKPRMVFGPVPTIEETKEATSQLKDALEQVYLSSPKSSGTAASFSDVLETKACITRESSVPKSAMQAFKLLKESPAAQNVVASIACDPNVWNAVMKNPDLVEFLESEKNSNVSVSPKFHGQDFEDSSENNNPEELDGLMAMLENVKVTVLDMVHHLTNMVQSWFSTPRMERINEYVDGKLCQNYVAGGSFMALAMMVIMVVVLKR